MFHAEPVHDNQSAMDLIFKFKENKYVDSEYKITDKLVEDIKNNKVDVPVELNNFKDSIRELMQSIYDTASFKACDNEKADNIYANPLKPNENFYKKEFKDLWNKIKIKTVYEVDFNIVMS